MLQSLFTLASARKPLVTNAVRVYCSDAAKNAGKPKKLVGYWLLGCSGMVFVAVVLGVTINYVVIYNSIVHVIEVALEQIKK